MRSEAERKRVERYASGSMPVQAEGVNRNLRFFARLGVAQRRETTEERTQ
jgi:hypothetical protein